MDRELLIEIGTEELPASWLPSLTRQLGEHVAARLKALRLPPDAPSETFSTPRRLTVRVARIAERQSDLEEVVNGPAVSAAFKPDGSPTPAAVGFARKNGVEVNALERVETAKGTYLAFRRHVRGKAAVDVLPDVLTGVLRDMAFPKQMHWDAWLEDSRGELLFGRPIRWILFLYGGRVVPFTIRRSEAAQSGLVQEVRSAAVTYGHRFLATSGRAGRAIKVRSFDEYRAQADGELRHPRSGRAARQDRPRARRPRAAPGRSREHRRCDAVRPPAGSARPGRVPRGRCRDVHPGFPDAARRSADDDDDSPSAFLPGGQRRRQADARLPGGDEHAAGQRAPHLAQSRASPDGAAAGRTILLRRRPRAHARVAPAPAADAAIPQEARKLSREGGTVGAPRPVDGGRGVSGAGGGRGRGNRRAPRQGRSRSPTWFAS